MEDLTGMAIFARVVQSNSFTAAAKQTGLSPSAVSKHISQLERRLNSQLLRRSTRQLSLTEAGCTFYAYCARILLEAEAAEVAVAQLLAGPQGLVRLATPAAFSVSYLTPTLPRLLARYPELEIDLVVTDRPVEAVTAGLDLAIQIGDPATGSSLRARRLLDVEELVCASPEYLSVHPPPRTPEQLEVHTCLGLGGDKPTSKWYFFGPGNAKLAVPVTARLLTNDLLTLREAALAGAGVALLPSYAIAADVKAGRLCTLLADYRLKTTTAYALYPHSRYPLPKVRAVVDFLREQTA